VRRFAPQLFAQLFCFPLLFLFVTDSQAQYPIKPAPGRHVIQNGDLEYREVRPEIDPRYQLLAEQAVQADFRKLQVLNIDLLKRVFRRSPETSDKPGYKGIGSTLGEIKKVATRLRSNLRVPKIDENTRYDVELTPGVLLLDKSITSFVENPLFQNRRVVDPELAVRAGKDITEVVRLSDFLRKLTKGD
jgi:hypothetical protein